MTKVTATLALFLLLTVATGAKSALDGFDPNANYTIVAVVAQPDGKILIGGGFTTLAPNGGASVTRNYIARLNPDGTLDTAFDPNANNGVYSIAVQADGKILAGGGFTSIGGQTRNHIARLDATTGLADSFDPNADGEVDTVAVQADGKILLGGGFYFIHGQTRSSIARLDATTGLPDSFNPNAIGNVNSIALQADGKIVVGGAFYRIGGQKRNAIARLDATTGLADSFDPSAHGGGVFSVAVQTDGKVLASGLFYNIGGQPRFCIARLDRTTGLADSFDPNPSNAVDAIAVQADGKVLVGGNFTGIGGQTRNFIARLDPTTGLADSFDPNPNNAVFAIAVQADGKFVVGGSFTTIAPNGGGSVTRHRIARLSDGSLPGTLGNISTRLRVETGNNVLIGGFIVTGTQQKRVILRAIGPSLPVVGALTNPLLELRDSSGGLIRSNDNWRSDQETEIIATGIPPANDLESAIVAMLPANSSAYTATVRGVDNGTGVGLVEVYDLDRTVDSKLANISTRGFVQTEENVLIGGLIVLGQNPLRVIVRAIGPSLPVPGALANPTLELHDGNGALIASNDDWRSDQEAEIIGTGIPPSNDLESAIVRNLAPGNYTAIVRGVNNATGIALVEAYDLN